MRSHFAPEFGLPLSDSNHYRKSCLRGVFRKLFSRGSSNVHGQGFYPSGTSCNKFPAMRVSAPVPLAEMAGRPTLGGLPEENDVTFGVFGRLKSVQLIAQR